MAEFLLVFQAVLRVFGLSAAGFALRHFRILTKRLDDRLLQVTINVLLPALIFDSILGSKAVEDHRTLLLAPLIGFGTVALGIFLAFALRHWTGLKNENSERTFAFTVGVYNYGYVPLPLALLLFHRETAAVLFVHNVGVEIALWTFGIVMLSGASIRTEWRKLLNAPLIAILATLLLNFAIGKEHVPAWLLTLAHWLGQGAIPLALVLIGAIVADYAHELNLIGTWRTSATACLIRLGILPVVFLLLAWVLPIPLELRRVMALEAAMPAAVFPIVMARVYGGDPRTACRVVVVTSLVGLLTIPLWLRAGMAWLGLAPLH